MTTVTINLPSLQITYQKSDNNLDEFKQMCCISITDSNPKLRFNNFGPIDSSTSNASPQHLPESDTGYDGSSEESTENFNAEEPSVPVNSEYDSIRFRVEKMKSTYERVRNKVEEFARKHDKFKKRINLIIKAVLFLDHHLDKLIKLPGLSYLSTKIRSYKLILNQNAHSVSMDLLVEIADLYFTPYRNFKKIYKQNSTDAYLIENAAELNENFNTLRVIQKTYHKLKKKIASEFMQVKLTVKELRGLVKEDLRRAIYVLPYEVDKTLFGISSNASNMKALKRHLANLSNPH